MKEGMDRRTFLKRTVGASVILGFPWLTNFADGKEEQNIVAEALARSKTERKPVIAMLFPKGFANQDGMGHDLENLLNSDKPTVHQLFCEAIFVCIPPAESERQFTQYKPQGTVLCLDQSGKIIDSASLEAGMFRERFVSNVGALIHGKDDKRLLAYADEQRKALDSDAAARIDGMATRLGAAQPQDRDTASKELAALAPRATAILALKRMQTVDPEVKHRIDQLFSALFTAASSTQPSVRLPYGVEWTEGSMACGGHCGIAEQTVMVACGMAVVAPASRKYLQYITKASR